MSDERPFLRVIAGGSEPTPEVRPWRCPVCASAGRPSGPVISVHLEAFMSPTGISPGETRYACLACHSRGVLTLV